MKLNPVSLSHSTDLKIIYCYENRTDVYLKIPIDINTNEDSQHNIYILYKQIFHISGGGFLLVCFVVLRPSQQPWSSRDGHLT